MKQPQSLRAAHPARWLAVTAMLMAMNIALSSFGIPVPGGHFYLNDIVIVTAAILLDPLGAFMVGGVGAFLGDFFFYPAPMFVSLATHGLQAVLISWLVCRAPENKKLRMAILAALLGAAVNVVGYSLGRVFLYSTPEYALLKFPFQLLQAGVGSVLAVVLCFPCGIRRAFRQIVE